MGEELRNHEKAPSMFKEQNDQKILKCELRSCDDHHQTLSTPRTHVTQ